MLDRYELGRWFFETFGFRLSYLPWTAIPILAGSLVLPLLAWWLQRRQLISTGAHRMVEIVWLVLLTLVAALGWGMWAVDYCDRIAADRVTPFVYGIFVGIAIGVLSVSGIGQWRVNKCLAVKPLLTALFLVATHIVLFYACLMTVGIVGLFFVVPRDAPLAALFLPNWIGQLFVVLAFALYVLSVAWVVPAIFRRWKKRGIADPAS